MQINYWWRKLEQWATGNQYELIRVRSIGERSRAVMVRDWGDVGQGDRYFVGIPVIMNRGEVALADETIHPSFESAASTLEVIH